MGNLHIQLASRCVKDGGVIAYPTEAVYGLGCNPWEFKAVSRILALKRRNPNKGLIIVAAAFEQLRSLVELTDSVLVDEVMDSWPGPVTWILPAKNTVPVWLRGNQGGIAVRVTANQIVQELCLSTGILVSTSANPEGYRPAINPFQVRAYFGNRLDYILPGPTGGCRQPTEIRHAVSGKTIRPSRRG